MADRQYRWNTADTINQEMPRTVGAQTGITYTVEGLPSGLIFNPVTHRVTGRATFVGVGEGSITATAPAPSTSTAVLTFEWTTAGLEFTGAPAIIWDINETVDYELPEVFAFNPTYTLTGLPAGLTWNQSAHTLEGTVTTVSTGTIVMTAAVGTENARTTINWEVSAALSISVTEMQFSWDTTQWINIQMPRTRNELTGTTYSISGLPVGIVYRDSDHRLVGSPIAAGSGTGMFTATLGSETTDIPLIWNVTASPITGDPHIYAFPRDPEPRGLYEINILNAAQTTRIDTLPMTFSRQMSLVDHNGILFGIHDREFWRVSPSNPADSVQIATLTEHVGHQTAVRSDGTLIYVYSGTQTFTLDPAAIVDGQLTPTNLHQNPAGTVVHDGIEINGQYYYFDLLNNTRWRIWRLNNADAAQSTDVGELPEIGIHIGVGVLDGQIYIAGEQMVGGEPHDFLWILNSIEFPSNLTLLGELPTTGTHEFHNCQNMATFTAPPQAPSFYTDSIDFAWDTILEVDYDLPRLLNEPVGTTYAVSGLPAGVTFDSTNHELEGTPDGATTGLTGVGVLTATVGSDTYTINLNWSIAYILQFAEMSIDIDAWPAGEVLDYDLPRALNEQMGTTYRVSGDLPAGVMFDAADHSLEGTVQVPLEFADDSRDVNWRVNRVVSYTLPRIRFGQTGVVYTVTGLPTGITYNSTHHRLEGTPMAVSTGTATLTATYQGDTATLDINWSVAVIEFLDTSDRMLQFDTATAASYSLPRVDEEPIGVVYSATGLPAGVTYNATDHALEGTPTMAGTGTAIFTATLGAQSISINLVWTVTRANTMLYASILGQAWRLLPSQSVLGTFNQSGAWVPVNGTIYVINRDGAYRIGLNPYTITQVVNFTTQAPQFQNVGFALGDTVYLLNRRTTSTEDSWTVQVSDLEAATGGNIPWTALNAGDIVEGNTGIRGATTHRNVPYYYDSNRYLYRVDDVSNLAASVQISNPIPEFGDPGAGWGVRGGMASVGGSIYVGQSREFQTRHRSGLIRIDDLEDPSTAVSLGFNYYVSGSHSIISNMAAI